MSNNITCVCDFSMRLSGGGGGGGGGHSYTLDFIQAWRIEKNESGSSFGGGGEVSEEVETFGELKLPLCLPPLNDRLPRAVNNIMQFSYSMTPLPNFWIRPCEH